MKVSKTLQYNSSTQAAGAKLCQDLGVFTGAVDSWSAKNSYSGRVCVCDCMYKINFLHNEQKSTAQNK